MLWEDCKPAFHVDGSWRDVYFLNTNIRHWERLLEFVRALKSRVSYKRGGKPTSLPQTVASIFKDSECTHLLSIHLKGVLVNCHFFDETEIELDIDPREISSQADVDVFVEFLSNLGRFLELDAIVTDENSPEAIWFRYNALKDEITYEPPGWWVAQNPV